MDCIINPLTGRAVKIDSPAGRRALKYNAKNKIDTSHECVINPRTGRAVKKDSAVGRKILKGLIPEVKPKATKKEPPAPIAIPKKKYDFGDFKTPTKYPDSPPLARTKSVPKNIGKTKKEPKPKPPPKAYTMYKKPIGPVKPEPKAYTMYKKPIGPVKPVNNKLAKLEEFINDTENYLNKKSTRAYNVLIKKYENKDYIASIIGAQMFSDFYPTSQKCLSHYSDYLEYIDENDVILEPTAGLGSIVLWLLKNKVESKIITTDFDANLNEYLKESFANIKQVSVLNHIKSNYLKIENDFNRYNPSIIFLNPPFSNKGDKKYYLNFLFKAIYDLKMSEHPHMERQLFFISPQLTKGNEKDGQQINFENIVISENKKKEIKNMLNIDEDQWIELTPTIITKVKTCNDFGGTNMEAVLYHMNIFY